MQCSFTRLLRRARMVFPGVASYLVKARGPWPEGILAGEVLREYTSAVLLTESGLEKCRTAGSGKVDQQRADRKREQTPKQ